MEGAVTVAVALLMTFAGFQMVETAEAWGAHATATPTQPEIGVPVLQSATATAGHCAVDLPHVEEFHG